MLLKISQSSLENTVLQTLQTCNFIKKNLKYRCFPMNIAKFLRGHFFYITPPVAASGYWKENDFSDGSRKFKEVTFKKKWAQKSCFYAEVIQIWSRAILTVKDSSLTWGVLCIIFWLKKIALKGSYIFLNKLIRTNSLIIKVLTRGFPMLDTMMKNEW